MLFKIVYSFNHHHIFSNNLLFLNARTVRVFPNSHCNLGQFKCEIKTTPLPISIMEKWHILFCTGIYH